MIGGMGKEKLIKDWVRSEKLEWGGIIEEVW